MEKFENIYFVGVGGIGMSALARFFKSKGRHVCGYDRTETELTKKLTEEGIEIHYTDDVNLIPKNFTKENTLVVYTPAVPIEYSEYQHFIKNGYKIMKRSEVLGFITNNKLSICVAGTHGKTSTSAITAHILRNSAVDCSAFLGGIVNNYNSNLILQKNPNKETYIVCEADEFDRSFLRLNPYFAIITSLEADHLDIYENKEQVRESFIQYIKQIQPFGTLLINKKVIETELQDVREIHPDIELYSYSLDEGADFYAENIRVSDGCFLFDIVMPNNKRMDGMITHYPGLHNVENAIASCVTAYLCGATETEIKEGLKSFNGVRRRFEYRIRTEKLVFIDDYAHHPTELKAIIGSLKYMYPKKKLTVVFQPHLYTRTRDFAEDFAKSLSLADDLVLLDIYPARELPIKGVTSNIIFDNVEISNKIQCSKAELLDVLKNKNIEILLTVGAGDIDMFLEPIENILKSKY